jgi:hypothetical protein
VHDAPRRHQRRADAVEGRPVDQVVLAVHEEQRIETAGALQRRARHQPPGGVDAADRMLRIG